jgi:hypothetical protein
MKSMCLPLMVMKFVAPIETPFAAAIATFNKTMEGAIVRKMDFVVASEVANTTEFSGAAIAKVFLGPHIYMDCRIFGSASGLRSAQFKRQAYILC